MKAFTTMNNDERKIFEAAWGALSKENQDIMLHFGADCYLNGMMSGIFKGACAAGCGFLIGMVGSTVYDIVKEKMEAKKVMKQLESIK